MSYIVRNKNLSSQYTTTDDATINVIFLLEDNHGTARHRVKIVWTDSRTPGKLFSKGLRAKNAIMRLDEDNQIRYILDISDVELK